MSQLCPREKQKSEKNKTKQNKCKCNCYNQQWWAVATQSLKGNGYKTVDATRCPLCRQEGVRPGRPCHGCACKHGKGCAMQACVILHKRHQQLGSHRIMLSVGAGKALPTWGMRTARCTLYPIVLDDPLGSLPARTSAEPSSNGWALHATHKLEVHNPVLSGACHRDGDGEAVPFYLISVLIVLFCFVLFCYFFTFFSRGHNWDIIPASHHKRPRKQGR